MLSIIAYILCFRKRLRPDERKFMRRPKKESVTKER